MSSPAPGTSARAATGAVEGLVGRHAERRRLAELIAANGETVLVHGPGGIGKTALVDGVLAAAGSRSVVVDGRDTEPTVPGFLAALGAALGRRLTTTADAGTALAAASTAVLVVDHLEHLRLLDAWLLGDLAGALPAEVTLMLVGRRGPQGAWRRSRGRAPAELALGPMTDGDVQLLLTRRGVDPRTAAELGRWARGHPLAAELGAEAWRRGAVPRAGATPGDVLEELFAVLLDDLDDEERAVVEAATVLRRITRPGLAAVLGPEHDVEAAWQLLRTLPFTSLTPAGLELEGVARDVISEAVELRDPVGVRLRRARAAAALFVAVDDSPDWQTTADLIYLVQNPLIRNAYLPPGGVQHPVDRAELHDRQSLLDISARWEGPVARRLTEVWWDLCPAAFRVVRGEDGEPRAFSVVTSVVEVPAAVRDLDPAVRAVDDHLRAQPVPPGQVSWLVRTTLDARTGGGRGPDIAALVVDLKRVYFEQRRQLRRVYAVVHDWGESGPTLRVMGFDRLAAPVLVGERPLTVAVLDVGDGGVAAWLAGHVRVETASSSGATRRDGVDPADAAAAVALRGLSPREREVLALVADGLTNRQLAAALVISERTANRHVSNIFAKLDVNNRTAAARWAVRAGLVD